MTYRTLSSMAAALLLILAAACDSDGDAAKQDAGPETTGSQPTKEQKQEDDESAQKDERTRPSASSKESGTIHDQPPPKLDGLVQSSDLKQLTGTDSYETTELPGRDPAPDYNSRRFKPRGGDGYGAGIQIWRFEKAGPAQTRLEEFRSQYLNTEDIPKSKRKELGSGAFISTRGGIRNILFAVGDPPTVAALSCSEDSCGAEQKFLDFAVRVKNRLSNRTDAKNSDESGGSNESEEKREESNDSSDTESE